MIAICSMIRKPLNFETWLAYHFSIGVEYFFLRIEETPELKEIVDKYPGKIFPEYCDDVSKLDNYHTIQDRQASFINKSIQDSLEYPIRWMFHIDCDELIWTKKPLISILTPISKSFDCVHFQNFEATYPNDDLQNPFVNTNSFIRCRDGNCLSYGNGKSAGRINEALRTHGPHFFTGKIYEVSDKVGAILHFDSPNFDEWYKKFKNLSEVTTEKFKKIPFQFYKDSINIIREGNIDDARDYYNKMKVATYNKETNIKVNF